VVHAEEVYRRVLDVWGGHGTFKPTWRSVAHLTLELRASYISLDGQSDAVKHSRQVIVQVASVLGGGGWRGAADFLGILPKDENGRRKVQRLYTGNLVPEDVGLPAGAPASPLVRRVLLSPEMLQLTPREYSYWPDAVHRRIYRRYVQWLMNCSVTSSFKTRAVSDPFSDTKEVRSLQYMLVREERVVVRSAVLQRQPT
jgi:hypothetical protein